MAPNVEGRVVGKLGGNAGRARRLRGDATDAERVVWRHLRGRSLLGVKFRRQLPIGPYVADFGSLEAKLVIEIDGGQHADDPREPQRTAYLAKHGFRVLRFWNVDVRTNLQGVIDTIAADLQHHVRLKTRAKADE
ncbi:MAG: DUF559 domain-containing protein [Alphaproteobacteria bacterium]